MEGVYLAVLEAIDADQPHQQIPEGATEPEPSELSSKRRKLAKYFEDITGPSEQSQSLSPEEIAANEYEAEDPELLESQEPLKWWKAREHQLKYLSRVVKRVFCIRAAEQLRFPDFQLSRIT